MKMFDNAVKTIPDFDKCRTNKRLEKKSGC